jgi:hypothetical protein
MAIANGEKSDWAKWVIGWFVGFLLATIPQMLIYSSRFAVNETETKRNTLDIKELENKGSDPVQTMVNDIAWLKREMEQMSKKLDEHMKGPLSMVTP